MAEGQENRIAIVTVHGTGDTAAGPNGEKWFQNGSHFVELLKKRLEERGVQADVIPHLWSGANSARGRESGANSLTSLLNALRKRYDAVHLIGHSHGGNVANDAAVAVGWSGDGCKSQLKTLTTIGAPFFRRDIGLVEWLGSFLFVSLVRVAMALTAALLLFSIVFAFAPPFTSPITYYEGRVREQAAAAHATLTAQELRTQAEQLRSTEVREARERTPGSALTAGVIALIVLAALFPLQKLARNGWLRVSRIRRRARRQASVGAILHPNDEAIAFLRRVEALPLTAFPRGALWRGSHLLAVNGAVWVLLLISIVLFGFWIAGAYGVKDVLGLDFPNVGATAEMRNGVTGARIIRDPNPVGDFGAWMLLYMALLSPFLFFFIYGVIRFFTGAIPEWFMRGWYNGLVTNALKGLAFGRDGDERIGRVSTQSHNFSTEEIVLDGDVAARMQAAAHDSADALLQKYRWSLFSVEDHADDTAMQALATDAITWDSLIHTTYFDQPELADMIAERITQRPVMAAPTTAVV